jgi:hypothetical protein
MSDVIIPEPYDKDWRTRARFIEVKPISLDDVCKGTGFIQKLDEDALLPKVNIGSIRVGNKRKGSKFSPLMDELIIDIDRSDPILGNKHVLNDPSDNEERNRVILAYEKDLKEDEKKKGPMTCEISKIAAKVLAGKKVICMCWCAPTNCHGDLIVSRVNKVIREYLSDPVNAKSVGAMQSGSVSQPAIRFGKYKGKEFSWIKQNDSGYWHWMLENIDGIEKQIPKNLL